MKVCDAKSGSIGRIVEQSETRCDPIAERKMKSYTKSQLASFAGVSPATFRRWLQSDTAYFHQNNITPQTKLLPPQVVAYLATKYAIELPDSLA